MTASDDVKRGPGRPKTLDFKAAELKLYISPDADQDFKAIVRDTGVSGTEIGRRLISFFVECPPAIRMAIIGRASEVTEQQWALVARLFMPTDEGDDDAPGPPMPINPKPKTPAGGATDHPGKARKVARRKPKQGGKRTTGGEPK